jgi:predicted amidohydrolase YtcJ
MDFEPGKDFAHAAADLTDEEVTRLFRVVEQVRTKYAGKPNTADNLEHLRDETLTRLMDIGILATLDPAPCFYGEPPVIEVIGKVSTDSLHRYGFDHERKGWEVNKANERNEDWLGEKEAINKRKKE